MSSRFEIGMPGVPLVQSKPEAAVVVVHTSCRICAGPLEEVLDLGPQRLPEFTDRPFDFKYPLVPLTLMLCKAKDCGLVQLRETAPREWLYEEYWYRSGINESMVQALGEITDRGRELVALAESDWVMDIGANDGTLLRQYTFPLYYQRHLRGDENGKAKDAPFPQRIAFDPAKNLQEELARSCEIVVPDFFPSKTYSGPHPKLITSIAMFYDLEDPNAFVAEIKRILHPDGVWILQLGDLLSLYASMGFDSICHEHLEYYSMTSLFNLLRRHDLVPFDAEKNLVNGGSLRVFVKHAAAHPNQGSMVGELMDAEKRLRFDTPSPYAGINALIQVYRREVRLLIEEARAGGGAVDFYGASTKGNTLIQSFGLDGTIIRAAWERSAAKWGKYTTTGVPIVSEAQGRADKPAPSLLLVQPWHFRQSILQREAKYHREGGRFLFPLPAPQLV